MFHSVQFLPAQSALFLSWFSRCPWVKRCSKYLMWKSQGFFLLFLLEQVASLIFIKKCTWIKTYKTSWSKFCSSLINRHFWSTHCFSTIVLCIRDSNTKFFLLKDSVIIPSWLEMETGTVGVRITPFDTIGYCKAYVLSLSFVWYTAFIYIQLPYYIFLFFSRYLNLAAVTNLDIKHLLCGAHLYKTLLCNMEYI